jgi:hypothetical protein
VDDNWMNVITGKDAFHAKIEGINAIYALEVNG